MTTDWSVPAWTAAVAAAVLVALLAVLVLALRGRARAARRARAAESATAELRARVDDLERRVESRTPRRTPAEREYVITSLGDERPAAPVPAIPAPAFADAVLRETVVHTAALLHGVRRALSPEVRNRVRFEMRRELRRTRKARKAEAREALREYRARHRADAGEPEGEVA
jgi:hypothetical protein